MPAGVQHLMRYASLHDGLNRSRRPGQLQQSQQVFQVGRVVKLMLVRPCGAMNLRSASGLIFSIGSLNGTRSTIRRPSFPCYWHAGMRRGRGQLHQSPDRFCLEAVREALRGLHRGGATSIGRPSAWLRTIRLRSNAIWPRRCGRSHRDSPCGGRRAARFTLARKIE